MSEDLRFALFSSRARGRELDCEIALPMMCRSSMECLAANICRAHEARIWKVWITKRRILKIADWRVKLERRSVEDRQMRNRFYQCSIVSSSESWKQGAHLTPELFIAFSAAEGPTGPLSVNQVR